MGLKFSSQQETKSKKSIRENDQLKKIREEIRQSRPPEKIPITKPISGINASHIGYENGLDLVANLIPYLNTEPKQSALLYETPDDSKTSLNSAITSISAPNSVSGILSDASQVRRSFSGRDVKSSSTILEPQWIQEAGFEKGEKTATIDWNKTFEKTLLCSSNSVEKYESLEKIASDFIYAASAFAQIIISERHLPIENKTIKPASLGGIAGGHKYICQGILFKFAVDTPLGVSKNKWMYGGDTPDDSAAMKAAGNELRSLHHIFGVVPSEKVNVPLMAMIDFKGFRVIAMSLLPIDNTTIQYGSSDGREIHSDNEEFNQVLEKCGKELNLKGHYVGTKESKKFLYFPGDVEGHLGKDGKYYLLDFQRVCPPEAPIENTSGLSSRSRDVFYKLLRPELVRSFPTPLSSDAFTRWGDSDENKSQSEKEVLEATLELYEKRIPKLALNLETSLQRLTKSEYNLTCLKEIRFFLDNYHLSCRIHRYGVCMRHLGYIRALVTNEQHKDYLLNAACSRILKSEIRHLWRKQMETDGSPSEKPFRNIIVSYFNRFLFGSIQEKKRFEEFWCVWIKEQLERKFPHILSDEEKLNDFCLYSKINPKIIFVELSRMIRFSASRTFIRVLDKAIDLKTVEMEESDLIDIGVRTKQLFVLHLASGIFYSLKASNSKNSDSRLLKNANYFVRNAMEALPACPAIGASWATILSSQAQKKSQGRTAYLYYQLSDEKFSESTKLVPSKESFLRWAETLSSFSQLLSDSGNFLESEEYLSRAENIRNTAHEQPSVDCMSCSKRVYGSFFYKLLSENTPSSSPSSSSSSSSSIVRTISIPVEKKGNRTTFSFSDRTMYEQSKYEHSKTNDYQRNRYNKY